MISKNPQIKISVGEARPHISMKKLCNRRKWDGHKLGQIALAIAVNELVYRYDGEENDQGMNVILRVRPLLSEYNELIYSEYATVYQVLHIMQKDNSLCESYLHDGINVLMTAADMVELYGELKKRKVETDTIKKYCHTPDRLTPALTYAKAIIKDAIKRRQAVNEIYKALAAVYFKPIEELVKIPMRQRADILFYTRRRNEIVSVTSVYYNIGEPGKNLLPELSIKDLRVPEAAAKRIKIAIRNYAFTTAAKSQLLAYSNHIVDMYRAKE